VTPPPGTVRLTVLVGETDVVGHPPLYVEMVHEAHAAGLRRASVFRGVEGFGRVSAVHTNRLLDLSGDLLVAVMIVDEATRVRAILDGATESWQTGLVTVEDVTVVGPPGGNRPG
jgi:PII-like signaling protein